MYRVYRSLNSVTVQSLVTIYGYYRGYYLYLGSLPGRVFGSHGSHPRRPTQPAPYGCAGLVVAAGSRRSTRKPCELCKNQQGSLATLAFSGRIVLR